jgi:hypothetical protein
MRRWTRATPAYVRTCGSCGTVIPAGDPLQEWTLPGVRQSRIRCTACALGPVPPDLPAHVETTADAAFERRLERLANRLPLDWRARQAGERDSGEEG